MMEKEAQVVSIVVWTSITNVNLGFTYRNLSFPRFLRQVAGCLIVPCFKEFYSAESSRYLKIFASSVFGKSLNPLRVC
jgi:hypothetical protein